MKTLAAPAATSVDLDLDARLALRAAEMTVRLETTALALDVNAAVPKTVVDWAEIVHLPVDTQPADDTTPVAALLRRAQQRILRDGWCRTAARTDSGGMCLAEAIHAEARSHNDESEARLLLRHALGGGDPIPEQNRRLTSAAEAAQVLATATHLAAARGI